MKLDATLTDYCDGEDFKEHELFGQDSLSLVLHCYYDDFQVTNPLGAKTKKHKIGIRSTCIYIPTHPHTYIHICIHIHMHSYILIHKLRQVPKSPQISTQSEESH